MMVQNPLKCLAIIIFITIIFDWTRGDVLYSISLATEISGWTTAAQFPEELAFRTSVEKNGFLYIVGGRQQDSDPSKEVYFASLHQDGSVGVWQQTSELPGRGLYLHSLSATDEHLYAIGGWDRAIQYNTVLRATFQSDGQLSAWSEIMPSYPLALYLHTTVIVNDRIYVIGGWDENRSSGLQQVYYADIQDNGDLGTWMRVADLPTPLFRHTTVVHNNNIYVIGGYDGENVRSEIYRATVNPDGTLGAWQQMANLPQPREYHQTVIHDGHLVVIGGRDASGNDLDSVIAATINDDGSLGEWIPLPSLPQSLYRFAAVSAERHNSDYIYVMGGIHGDVTQNTVYHSDIPPPPTATPTNTLTPTPTPTITPTPTNTPMPAIRLDHNPKGSISYGEDVIYTINYDSPGMDNLQELILTNPIPEGVVLIADSIKPSGTLINGNKSIEWRLTGDPMRPGSVSYQVARSPIFTITAQKPFFEINRFTKISMSFEGFNMTGNEVYVNSELVEIKNGESLDTRFDKPGRYTVTVIVSHDNPFFEKQCSEIFVTAIEAKININNLTQAPYNVPRGETVRLNVQILPDYLNADEFEYGWSTNVGVITGVSTNPTTSAVYPDVGEQIVEVKITHPELAQTILITETLTVVEPGLAAGYIARSAASANVMDEVTEVVAEPLCEEKPPVYEGIIINEGVQAQWQFRDRRMESSSNLVVNGFTLYLPVISK